MFMFQSEKSGHMIQIVGTGLAGCYAELMLTTVTTSEIIAAIQVGAQVLIALVTCIAAIRKAMQKPTISIIQPNDHVQANKNTA